MTTTEYALNFALVGLVLLQIRGIKVTKAALLFPVVMTLWIATSLLKAIPTARQRPVLESAARWPARPWARWPGWPPRSPVAARPRSPRPGALAAVLWVAGIGARVAFSLWVGHGGAATIRDFSIAHHITGGAAWGTAFILMAMTEVATRTGVIFVKTRRTGAVIERGGLIRRFVTA